jgi:hypothetical protein
MFRPINSASGDGVLGAGSDDGEGSFAFAAGGGGSEGGAGSDEDGSDDAGGSDARAASAWSASAGRDATVSASNTPHTARSQVTRLFIQGFLEEPRPISRVIVEKGQRFTCLCPDEGLRKTPLDAKTPEKAALG